MRMRSRSVQIWVKAFPMMPMGMAMKRMLLSRRAETAKRPASVTGTSPPNVVTVTIVIHMASVKHVTWLLGSTRYMREAKRSTMTSSSMRRKAKASCVSSRTCRKRWNCFNHRSSFRSRRSGTTQRRTNSTGLLPSGGSKPTDARTTIGAAAAKSATLYTPIRKPHVFGHTQYRKTSSSPKTTSNTTPYIMTPATPKSCQNTWEKFGTRLTSADRNTNGGQNRAYHSAALLDPGSSKKEEIASTQRPRGLKGVTPFRDSTVSLSERPAELFGVRLASISEVVVGSLSGERQGTAFGDLVMEPFLPQLSCMDSRMATMPVSQRVSCEVS
mmetsp:Transcript_115229/g.367649  ORF Transcript_115229/g.367649 Transcript_115229/m.367649 type:complete len:328 (-) Transcript_115229:395-1378(-)